ncbi:hypothetical protein KC131_21000 [Pseudomonas sp. JQ170]|uniref:glycosyltransferase family 32 protein n=1 Tax=unclassified Pseudomonas TaxID=196821 RepID=UPI00264CD89B|nr:MULTISPECIES: capsular polysaccharide synthesis protein [unclassified Pseudomonas]MDN7143132.1 hypothetical protein [Pseudomonas sp. JQ170]WRO74377.1 capsular polysaccharide synthesis protein [Pseudomonas sp. 170C]
MTAIEEIDISLSPRFIGWHGSKSNPQRNRAIPKKIWTYWNSEEAPKTVRACMKSWKDKNPDYEITQLNPNNLQAYLREVPEQFYSDTPQRQADWVRLAVLREHGGVWLDSTTVTFERLDFLHQIQRVHGSELIAFFNKQHTSNPLYPIIENWFIAAPEKSKFISDWYDEFGKSIANGAGKYIEQLGKEFNIHELAQNLKKHNYFSMHIAAQALMNRENNYSLSLMPADSDAFKIARHFSWSLEKIADAMCKADNLNVPCNLFKMTGKVWDPINQMLTSGDYLPSSIMGKLYDSTF